MTSEKKNAIDAFISQPILALVGVSRSGKKYGNLVLRELKAKGIRIYPVHPEAEVIDGERCYPNLASLPEPVGGVIVVVPPSKTETVVKEAHAAGIKRIWMQQGAESPAAIRYCQENNLSVVHGECIMMFAQPVQSIHGFHRWINKVFGKLPN